MSGVLELRRARRERTLLLLVTNDWYAASHRLALVKAASDAGWRVVVATEVMAHRAVLEAAGAEVIHLAWWRAGGEWRTRNSAALLADVIRVCRRVRPHVVHCVALRPVLFGSLAARLVGIPGTVNAVAGQGFVFVSHSRLARVLRPVITRVLRIALNPRKGRVGRTILQNPDDRDFLVARGLVRRDLVTLIRGAGVDLDEFAPAPAPAGPLVVVLPARMLWEKGVREFVAAARRIRSMGVEARFCLVGGTLAGNSRWVDPAQLAAWQQEGIVEWWGQRND
ncbi:MAG: glycosyltransferase, partial [Gemmatimonadaceae bacterium]